MCKTGKLAQVFLTTVIMAAGAVTIFCADGVWYWAGGTAFVGGGLVLALTVIARALPRLGPRTTHVSANIWLLCVTVGLSAMAAETWLVATEPEAAQTPAGTSAAGPHVGALPTGQDQWRRFYTAEAEAARVARQGFLTMPPAWELRRVTVVGASEAYYWHGVLHVKDARGMRFTAPIPPKRPGVFRIAVFGDSLTYGDGVEQEFTYPALLAKELGAKGTIEVINLGHDGWQSEDILNEMKERWPELLPDLVLYGACLNDFLDSGMGQYNSLRAFAFPLPESVKRSVIKRTRLGKLIDDSYDRLLRTMRLRVDFFEDILGNINSYRDRFRRDVADMNTFVTSHGDPPVVAMVLDQYPRLGGRGQRIAALAEDAMRAAGMDVIPTEDYYRAHDSIAYRVSPWEGHPDERAHAIFADRFCTHLVRRADVARYLSTTSQGKLATQCAN